MCPVIKSYLDRSDYFNGPFKIAYEDEYINIIINELKKVVSERFNLNAEEAACLLDPQLLDLTGVLDLYTNKELYNGYQNSI